MIYATRIWDSATVPYPFKVSTTILTYLTYHSESVYNMIYMLTCGADEVEENESTPKCLMRYVCNLVHTYSIFQVKK